MRCLSKRSRLPILAILSVAWLLAANHCNLFALSSSPSGHMCCDDTQAPTHKECNECCGHMAAPVPSGATVTVDLVALATTALPPDVAGTPVLSIPFIKRWSGMSPPGNIFVEFVLGSSLNSLAPPVFVS